MAKNRDAVTRFSPFRNRLPVNYQLDGLIQLGNAYFTLHDWMRLGESADNLIILAKVAYQEQQQRKTGRGKKPLLKTERNLVVYYGQGYLMKATACEKQGLYEEGKNDVENFKMFAVANSYTLDMLMGHADMLEEYTQYLFDHPEEILTGLAVITEAANKYGFAIEDTLTKLSNKMVKLEQRDENIYNHWRLNFHYQLAIYLLRKGRIEDVAVNILKMLETSVLLNNSSLFIQGISLFESCKDQVGDFQRNDCCLDLIKQNHTFRRSYRV
ncbi:MULTISPECIES: hypothetical protein [unclassified Paenibacillus]|uniref:hypothetical protein n=1 Tax=unclassified Paenibacillus TaxID=185978 RepID=UPI0024B97033|nr:MULTISPECIES: hypothetical protein [unclassified Paenibacillus]